MRLDDLKATELDELYDQMHGRSRSFREMCERIRPQNHREICALPFGHKGPCEWQRKSEGTR